jgi:hypothetical protein
MTLGPKEQAGTVGASIILDATRGNPHPATIISMPHKVVMSIIVVVGSISSSRPVSDTCSRPNEPIRTIVHYHQTSRL